MNDISELLVIPTGLFIMFRELLIDIQALYDAASRFEAKLVDAQLSCFGLRKKVLHFYMIRVEKNKFLITI